jgi:hypothetical protein
MTGAGWAGLRAEVAAHAPALPPPLPAAPGVCAACRGPARPEYLHCFPCAVHAAGARDLLADAVIPVAYAIKGGKHAHDLWVYKSAAPDAAQARATLLSLLLVFLRDHGGCAWRLAGGGRPSHVAVVPSTRGRPGRHPLEALASPFLALPWVHLAAAPHPDPPDPGDHDLSLNRFAIPARLTGARVLLLDDTWTTGSRVQSAAAALKLAGAAWVVAVVLGRHLSGLADTAKPFSSMLETRRYTMSEARLWPCPASRIRGGKLGHLLPVRGTAQPSR